MITLNQLVEKLVALVAILIAVGVLAYAVFQIPAFKDWHNAFYPAVCESSRNPYNVVEFLNPPWGAWLLSPLCLLGERLGGTILVTLSIILLGISTTALGANFATTIMVLLSPAGIRWLPLTGQLDALVLAGFVLLAQKESARLNAAGLVLLSLKPQVLGMAAIYKLIIGKDRTTLLLPLVFLILLSFMLYGWWLDDVYYNLNHGLNQGADFGPWPFGIPFGIGLFALAVRKRDIRLAGLSTFFLVPYVALTSLTAYIAVLFSTLDARINFVLFLALWVFDIWLTLVVI